MQAVARAVRSRSTMRITISNQATDLRFNPMEDSRNAIRFQIQISAAAVGPITRLTDKADLEIFPGLPIDFQVPIPDQDQERRHYRGLDLPPDLVQGERASDFPMRLGPDKEASVSEIQACALVRVAQANDCPAYNLDKAAPANGIRGCDRDRAARVNAGRLAAITISRTGTRISSTDSTTFTTTRLTSTTSITLAGITKIGSDRTAATSIMSASGDRMAIGATPAYGAQTVVIGDTQATSARMAPGDMRVTLVRLVIGREIGAGTTDMAQLGVTDVGIIFGVLTPLPWRSEPQCGG